MEVFETKSAKQTENLGRVLGSALRGEENRFTSTLRSIRVSKTRADRTFIMGLTGDLGSGKTTFVKGLAKGLGVAQTITSPTYIFIRSYSFEPIQRRGFNKDTLYHLDLYRVEDPQQAQKINLEEILNDKNGIVVVEWAEHLFNEHRPVHLSLQFDYSASGRKIVFRTTGL